MKETCPRGFVFYPQDYFGDQEVRLMPGELRIVWVEAFLLMTQSPQRGLLLKRNGSVYQAADLAGVMNLSVETVEKALAWVVREGIADVDRRTGALCCRKIIREENRRKLGSKFGKKGGGNPYFKAKFGQPEDQENTATSRAPYKGGPKGGPKGGAPLDLYTTDPEPDPDPKKGNGKILKNSIFPAASGPENPEPEPEPETPERDPDPDPNPDTDYLDPASEAEMARLNTKRPRPRDEAYEAFAEAHNRILDAIYVSKVGDFAQLAKLRAAYHIKARESPPHWAEAVRAYFSSPLGHYSLCDLCVRFAVFRNGPVDRFGKLGGGVDEQKRQNSKRAIEAFIRNGDASLH